MRPFFVLSILTTCLVAVTPAPTMEPTSEMVLSYSYATPAPVPAPTKQPIPAPTPMPTSFPTSTDTVAIAVSVAMSTTESAVSDSQKSTLKTSVAAASGVSENSIKDFAVIVTPARRRLSDSPKVSLRRLASYTWTINYKVVSSLSAAGHASVESFQAAIETSLQANLATTVLTDMDIAVVVTGVSTFATATTPTALYDCHGDDPDCIYFERFWGAANCTGWPGRRGTYDRIWYNSTMANGVCSNRSTWSADLFQVASCNEEGVFFKQNCEDSECTKCDSDAFHPWGCNKMGHGNYSMSFRQPLSGKCAKKKDDEDEGGPAVRAIIGIAVGAVVLLAGIGASVWYYYKVANVAAGPNSAAKPPGSEVIKTESRTSGFDA